MYLTERFADFIYNVSYEALPKEIVALTKERILDSVGAVLAGAGNWAYREPFLLACQKLGTGDTAAFTTGERKFPLARAVMIDTTFGHAVELDDGHAFAGAHAGTAVVPTALTVAKSLGLDGQSVIAAVVAGYDLVYRLAAAMAPWQIEKGFHPTSNDDTFGAAATAGKLMSLSKKELSNALGFAGLYASGLQEATVSGQLSKCVMVGNAAYSGMEAVYLAQSGMEGTLSVLEGENGFFRSKSKDVDIEKVCEDLGKSYRITDTYSKMYPTCRHAQPAIEGVLNLMEEYGFGSKEVRRVRVGTHEVACRLTGKIKAPKDSGEAKFSSAYGIAVALCEKGFGVRHLNPEYTQNPIYVGLAGCVDVEWDASVQAVYPKKRGAKVTVWLTDGRILTTEVYDLKGSPKNPVGFKEIRDKFIANVGNLMENERMERLIEGIMNLEKLDTVEPIMEILEQSAVGACISPR
ncbi:MAG: MmgE/PrpD family protein [Lachnospiraceae bacterium]|nr:MmgE/PrpD family protein [Lachnospiraceae bacterium]